MKRNELDGRLSNYLRTLRNNAGLTQTELSGAIGYRDGQTVARHERSYANPPLAVAISYAIIFRVPVSELFAGLHDQLGPNVEARLAQLEVKLGKRSARDRNARATARKLIWLSQRKDPAYRTNA